MLARIKKPAFFLSAIILFDAYLRLWKLPHLFLWINDYDEGAYSMGGRFIAQGFMPYKDFTLVHPPFYDLVLSAIYKVFGYNFFYGRYFSVLLSIACVILVYFIVKKLYNSTAALIAAFLFVIFPEFYSSWYRAVQEPLGIFLVLAGLYFAGTYIQSKKNGGHLLFSGLCLGLAVATKYTFIPAVAGFVAAIAIISTDWNWRKVSSYFGGLLKREFWILIAGIIAGFLMVTGYFIIKTPRLFFDQTLFSQLGYRVGNRFETISLKLARLSPGIHQILAFSRGTFAETISTLCVLLCIVLFIVLLFKKKRSKSDIFFLVTGLISLILCSFFNPIGETRYFVSFYLFILLAIVIFVPALNIDQAKQQITFHSLRSNITFIVTCLLLIFFLGSTIILRMDYNFLNSTNLTYEEQTYKETIAYLESVKAKKIYAIDPIIPALATNLNSALEFDTFGKIITIDGSPDKYFQSLVDEGVDYVVIDPFSLLGITSSGQNIRELISDIQKNGVLVKTIVPNDVAILGTQIYQVIHP